MQDLKPISNSVFDDWDFVEKKNLCDRHVNEVNKVISNSRAVNCQTKS